MKLTTDQLLALEVDEETDATSVDLDNWYRMKQMLSDLGEKEMKMRKKIVRTFFPKELNSEGVKKAPLSEGWYLEASFRLNRKIIPELLSAHAQEFHDAKLPMKELIKLKPDLSVTAYKALPEEKRKLFEKAMEIKPGAPSLDIVKPKRTPTSL